MKYLATSAICLLAVWLLTNLWSMWQADTAFALGKNLDGVQRYSDAYSFLQKAVVTDPGEPTFRDELAWNQAVLASALAPTATASARQLAATAITDSDQVVASSPNSMPFWKTRTRMFYQLATIDSKYYFDALTAIQKAAMLAPTDAKVHYNLGILYERTGKTEEAVTAFQETIVLKPNYREAYYTLGLYYDQLGQRDKAKETMQMILVKIGPDKEAQQWLEEHKN